MYQATFVQFVSGVPYPGFSPYQQYQQQPFPPAYPGLPWQPTTYSNQGGYLPPSHPIMVPQYNPIHVHVSGDVSRHGNTEGHTTAPACVTCITWSSSAVLSARPPPDRILGVRPRHNTAPTITEVTAEDAVVTQSDRTTDNNPTHSRAETTGTVPSPGAQNDDGDNMEDTEDSDNKMDMSSSESEDDLDKASRPGDLEHRSRDVSVVSRPPESPATPPIHTSDVMNTPAQISNDPVPREQPWSLDAILATSARGLPEHFSSGPVGIRSGATAASATNENHPSSPDNIISEVDDDDDDVMFIDTDYDLPKEKLKNVDYENKEDSEKETMDSSSTESSSSDEPDVPSKINLRLINSRLTSTSSDSTSQRLNLTSDSANIDVSYDTLSYHPAEETLAEGSRPEDDSVPRVLVDSEEVENLRCQICDRYFVDLDVLSSHILTTKMCLTRYKLQERTISTCTNPPRSMKYTGKMWDAIISKNVAKVSTTSRRRKGNRGRIVHVETLTDSDDSESVTRDDVSMSKPRSNPETPCKVSSGLERSASCPSAKKRLFEDEVKVKESASVKSGKKFQFTTRDAKKLEDLLLEPKVKGKRGRPCRTSCPTPSLPPETLPTPSTVIIETPPEPDLDDWSEEEYPSLRQRVTADVLSSALGPKARDFEEKLRRMAASSEGSTGKQKKCKRFVQPTVKESPPVNSSARIPQEAAKHLPHTGADQEEPRPTSGAFPLNSYHGVVTLPVSLAADRCPPAEHTVPCTDQGRKSKPSGESYKCPFCNRFFSPCVLQHHMQSPHDYVCTADKCFQKFILQEQLDAHRISHETFTCDNCGKTYKSKRSLGNHMAVHRKIKLDPPVTSSIYSKHVSSIVRTGSMPSSTTTGCPSVGEQTGTKARGTYVAPSATPLKEAVKQLCGDTSAGPIEDNTTNDGTKDSDYKVVNVSRTTALDIRDPASSPVNATEGDFLENLNTLDLSDVQVAKPKEAPPQDHDQGGEGKDNPDKVADDGLPGFSDLECRVPSFDDLYGL